MNNPMWEFTVTRYAHEAVASACLRAQDEAGSDVNLLLYAAWLAAAHCELSPRHLADIEIRLAPWRSRVVAPLRQLRCDWKGLAEAKELREAVKSVELRAEQHEVEQIWDAHVATAIQPTTGNVLGINLMRVLALTCPDRGQQEALCVALEAALANGEFTAQG